MASFNPSRGNITVLGNNVISIGRAKRLRDELDSVIDTAETYQDTVELHDIGTNERAIKYVTDPPTSPAYVNVELAFDTDTTIDDALAHEYCEDILDQTTSHNLVTVLVAAHNVPDLFHESTAISGFHVKHTTD